MKKLLITTLLIGAVAGSAMGQGLISLTGKAFYSTTLGAATGTAIALANPAQVGTFGVMNIGVVYNTSASAGLFSATTASSLTAGWVLAAPLDQRVSAPGGGLAATTITVGDTGTQEAFVVGWTGTYTTWDAAFAAAQANPNVLVGWSGRAGLGSLGWTQTSVLPPSTPVAIVSGTSGFAGIVLSPYVPVPEPGSFALAGLGLASLLILRRRK